MKETAEVRLDEDRRIERRLARGLEDVSYLFLSQPPNRPAGNAEEQKSSAGQFPLQPPQPIIPIPLRSFPSVDRELLISLLNRNAAVLEEGMRTIDKNVPCDPFGNIDLIAVDHLEHFSIIGVDTTQNDESLLRGIGCVDWIVRNTSIVRRMYPGRTIDFCAQPRLFLVAPSFSPLLKCAAQRCTSPKVTCFEYRTATIASSVGVLFERAGTLF
jgi:hypothetical protein